MGITTYLLALEYMKDGDIKEATRRLEQWAEKLEIPAENRCQATGSPQEISQGQVG